MKVELMVEMSVEWLEFEMAELMVVKWAGVKAALMVGWLGRKLAAELVVVKGKTMAGN